MPFKDLSQNVLKELSSVFDRISDDSVRPFLENIKQSKRIFLIGGGREGLATRSFAMRLMHLGKETHWVWDDTTPSLGEGDLLICSCGSADVGHVNHVAKRAHENNAKIALVTAAHTGYIGKFSDVILFIPATAFHAEGNVVPSTQLMGNLFEQMLFLLFDVLVMMLREEMNISVEEMVSRHRNIE